MIKVVNKRNGGVGVYIGRGSALGNPYKIGQHGTRDEVIAKYNTYLTERIAAKDKSICDALNDIWRKARSGDVSLVCYCAPLPCHGNVIKVFVERAL